MTIRRTAFTLLMFLFVSLILFTGAGCTARVSPGRIAGDTDPTGAEVTYWHTYTGPRDEALQEMVGEFNRTNEWGIRVKDEYSGQGDEIYRRMSIAITSGSLPELIDANPVQASAYRQKGVLVDLEPYVRDPRWGLGDELKDFYRGFLDQPTGSLQRGVRLGFPIHRSFEIMFYNAEWLKELGVKVPPDTWDDFSRIVEKATDPVTGRYGYVLRTDASSVFAMVASRGGDITNSDGSGYRFNTRPMKDSMNLMKKLCEKGFARRASGSSMGLADFAGRKALFTMGPSSALPFYRRALKGSEKGDFAWDISPLPHSTAKPLLNTYGKSLSIPRTTAEKQLSAWIFIRWMTGPAQQARWVEVTSEVPVRKLLPEQLGSYPSENPHFLKSLELLSSSSLKSEPSYSGYDSVRDAMSEAYNRILDGADIDQTLRQLEKDANRR